MNVTIDKFGKDHWSLLAYIEIRCVDHKGVPDRRHFRCDAKLHPGLAHHISDTEYPTRLKGKVELHDHDDWNCAEDLEAAQFIVYGGTGAHPVFEMTPAGFEMAAKLRMHKANGGMFSNFEYKQ